MELGSASGRSRPPTRTRLENDVYEQFASYNMLSLPVVDESGRLLGAVTVDDVVDRMLGSGWRLKRRRRPEAEPAVTP